MVDSGGPPVAVIEITAVKVMRLGDVDLEYALGEGGLHLGSRMAGCPRAVLVLRPRCAGPYVTRV